MATEAVLGPLEDSDRLGLETLLPRSPSPGGDHYRCPASTPSRHFRRDLSAKLRPQGPRGGFDFVSPSPVLNRRTVGRFSGSSLRRTARSQESVSLEGSALRRKMVEYYYVDKSWQRHQAAQTNTTWLKSLCSQPVDEILRKYRRKSELQKSKMLWSKTYSTPGERALLHAWESNVLKGTVAGFPGPGDSPLQQRGLVLTAAPGSRPVFSAEKVKGSSLAQSHAHARTSQPGGAGHSSGLQHHASRSEPSLKSSHYAGDAESSVSQADDHPPPPPPPSSAVWSQNGPVHSRGRGGNGQAFFRVSTNQQGGSGSSQRLPALSNREKAYMFRQRKYIANGGRGHYPATLDSGDHGQDSAAATTTAVSEELSQIFSVEPSPRIETSTPEEDVRLPHIQGRP